MSRIRSLEIKNFRSIGFAKADIGDGGLIVEGRSDSGKTTHLDALRAALAAVGVGANSIKLGEDKCEILVCTDDLTIRRVITAKGTSVTVSKDGGTKSSPQKFLNEIFGTSALDPLDLMLAKPKERRAIVLSALPVTVTEEQLRTWAPTLPAGFDCEGHGLDVVKRAHEIFYEQRTAANAKAKDAIATAERLKNEAPPVVEAPSLADAIAAFKAAERALANEEANERVLKEAIERNAAAAARSEKLKAEADAIVVGDIDGLRKSAEAASDALKIAREQLEKANDLFGATHFQLNRATDAARQKEALGREAAALATSAGLPDVKPDVEAARARLAAAEEQGKAARARDEAIKAQEAAKAARDAAEALDAEAKRLDGIVKALDKAPAKLLADADAIPGLSLMGDDVAIDKVVMSELSGIKKTKACIAIAKRLNAASKVLIVDGLERIDGDAMDEFVAEATKDGWQLIGSRVERGAIRYSLISNDEAAAAE